VSCTARGPYLFESAEEELSLIRDSLGAVPLVGFFANGEVFRDRIHTHSGVLTLFL
jgi:small ligand-binding sensory domain FIST